jgi:hypothetical protein
MSPDGTCGYNDAFVCKGSRFGSCCSAAGYWYDVLLIIEIFRSNNTLLVATQSMSALSIWAGKLENLFNPYNRKFKARVMS